MSSTPNAVPPPPGGKKSSVGSIVSQHAPAAIGILLLACVAFGMKYVVVASFLSSRRTEQVREHGQPAVAEVLSVRETNVYVNGKPRLRVEVRVIPPDAPEFSLEFTETMQYSNVGKYIEGNLLDVRYDPEKPDVIVVIGLAKPRLPSADERPQ